MSRGWRHPTRDSSKSANKNQRGRIFSRLSKPQIHFPFVRKTRPPHPPVRSTMMRFTLPVLLWSFVGPTALVAQYSKQYDDCLETADAQFAMLKCASEEAARTDAALNAIYRTLISATAIQPKVVSKIKAMERAWIAYRDAYCNRTETRWGFEWLRRRAEWSEHNFSSGRYLGVVLIGTGLSGPRFATVLVRRSNTARGYGTPLSRLAASSLGHLQTIW